MPKERMRTEPPACLDQFRQQRKQMPSIFHMPLCPVSQLWRDVICSLLGGKPTEESKGKGLNRGMTAKPYRFPRMSGERNYLLILIHLRKSSNSLPSTRKLLQMKIWRFSSAFAFVMEKADKFPQIWYCICFRNDHVGHAQATTAGHTYEVNLNPGGSLSLSVSYFNTEKS